MTPSTINNAEIRNEKIHGAFAATVVFSGKVEADDRNDAGLQAKQRNEKRSFAAYNTSPAGSDQGYSP